MPPLSRILLLALLLLWPPLTGSQPELLRPPEAQRLNREALRQRLVSLDADIRLEEFMLGWYQEGIAGRPQAAIREDIEKRLRQTERTLDLLYELRDEAQQALERQQEHPRR